ncbi:MAG: TPM domain-containing protein [Pseudomonadota bacterium]
MAHASHSWPQRCRRAFKHWISSTAVGRKAFPSATLKAIADAIGQGERLHRAEVRLVVETGLPVVSVWHGMSDRERARDLFAQYGVWDTEDNCGVLIYINLADRQVEIVADRNVGRRIAPEQWQAVCRAMTQGYAAGNYHDSTIGAIGALNTLLEQHFPAEGDRPNQLPNDAIIL